jgi:hypothetical protein
MFELDFANSTVCELFILSGAGVAAQVVGGCMVGWCLDYPRGVGVSTGFLAIPLFSRVIIDGGLSSQLIFCVDMVHWFSLWGEIKSEARVV